MASLVEPVTVYGYYPGEWSENLGGEQLAAAQELFPDYPEKIAEWDETIKETNDVLIHYATLIQAAKKAYTAAAKIAGENVGADNWDDLVENYKKANENYRKRLLGIIEDFQADIETLEERIAKFNQGIPQLDIAIAEAEKELKVETARLQGYEQALAYAKANLDKILEYIKSLDVNFVVPAVDFDD
jgi:chromosome segregation ATPase